MSLIPIVRFNEVGTKFLVDFRANLVDAVGQGRIKEWGWSIGCWVSRLGGFSMGEECSFLAAQESAR